mmetsp:Transcript_44565/g.43217  ORF Transcript_44565/g.43217 Transcript_44565/m.43217 type:complete len:124 (+) Transcript_44565:789-1160(+)
MKKAIKIMSVPRLMDKASQMLNYDKFEITKITQKGDSTRKDVNSSQREISFTILNKQDSQITSSNARESRNIQASFSNAHLQKAIRLSSAHHTRCSALGETPDLFNGIKSYSNKNNNFISGNT